MNFFPNYPMIPNGMLNGNMANWMGDINNVFNKFNEFENRIKKLEQKVSILENRTSNDGFNYQEPDNSFYMI